MLGRVVHLFLGAICFAGGAGLLWLQRSQLQSLSLFPPQPQSWMAIGAVALIATAIVFLAVAVTPRPRRNAARNAEAARRAEALSAADAYYAQRNRAADRDWRSGDLPPEPTPAATPVPTPTPVVAAPVTNGAARMPVDPFFDAAPATAKPAATKPVATAMPPVAAQPTPFPSTATLAAIPVSTDPPPAPIAAAPPAIEPAATPIAVAADAIVIANAAVATVAAAPDPFAAIRAAITGGRIEEADKLLTVARERAQGLELAELTGLAGDHAAAAGRQSNAKWLWRLALKRFGEAGAMESAPAQAVAERLRLADH